MARYIFLAAAIVIFAMFVQRLWRFRKTNEGEKRGQRLANHGLEGCRQLLLLVKALQRHRGLSSGFLAGDPTFAPAMSKAQAELDALFISFAPIARGESDMTWPCFTYNEWIMLRHHWDVLKVELETLSVDQNIARHSKIVDQMLEWLAALGEARLALAFPHRLPRGLALNYAHRLPALAECLGQARAIGSAAAACGSCPAATKGKLIYLASRAESLLQRIGEPAGHPAGAIAISATKRLIQVIRADLIESQQISLSATAYFDQASRTIDAIFVWIEEGAGELERNLHWERPLTA